MADENKEQTTYTLYEYNGTRYIYNPSTNILQRHGTTSDAAFIEIKNNDLKEKILNTSPVGMNASYTTAYDFLEGNKVYKAADGNTYYQNADGSYRTIEFVLDPSKDSKTELKVPNENIMVLRTDTNNPNKKSNQIIQKTWDTRSILSDEELSNMSGFSIGSHNFERLKGWYMQMIDLNKDIFGFDTAYNAWTYTGDKGLQQITDSDGNPVSYTAYINGDYIPEGATTSAGAQQSAFDKYWRDTYGYNTPGTTAKDFYDQFVASERSAGQSAINLANAQTQQLGLQQAAYVKNVTDQLKSERMARLRAGMSESQIASQDMQQLYANMNSLNDQIVASNMAALQGQEQINNAQSTAFQNWIANANQMAQSGSAYSAAQAGDISAQAKQYLDNLGLAYTPSNWSRAYEAVSGRDTTSSNPKVYTSK